MKPESAKRWVEALRSGKYKQGKRALATECDGSVRHCCLGVLCELAVADGVIAPPTLNSGRRVYDTEEAYLPPAVRVWCGVQSRTAIIYGKSLAELNDSGITFGEISDAIEQNMEAL